MREAIVPALMPKSSFYAVLKGEFIPNEEQRQRLADICGVMLEFAGTKYQPRTGSALTWRDQLQIQIGRAHV